MSYSDNYTRANSGTLGSPWEDIPLSSGFGIVSNTALAATTSADVFALYNNTTTADQFSQATLTITASAQSALFVRYTGTSRFDMNAYLLYITSSTTWSLQKAVNGSFSAIASGSGTFATGDVISLSASGTSTTILTFTKNGVNIASPVSDSSSPNTSGKTGIGGYNSSGSTTWTAWSGGSAAAAPAVLSSPTPSGTLGTTTTATCGATSDQNTGTLYCVVSASNNVSGASVAQIKAGQNSTGASAAFAGTSTVSTTAPTVALSGLSVNTLYYYALVQNNTNGDSNVVSGSFTTAAPLPTITDVDSDEVVVDAQSNVAITGTNLTGATFDLMDGAIASSQNVDSASGTAAQIDISLGNCRYGVRSLRATTGYGTGSLAVTINPPSGKSYVNLGTAGGDPADRITASGTLVSGDQLEISSVVGGTISDVTVNTDHTFSVSGGVTAFTVRAHNGTDWGSTGVQSIGVPATVPDVVGLSQAAATTAIGVAALVLGTVTTAHSPTVPAGYVISQTPAAASSSTEGSSVALVVSDGPAPPATTTVPNLVGSTESVASAAVVTAVLVVGSIAHAYSDVVADGLVIAQAPLAGATASEGSSVDFTVSMGPAPAATARQIVREVIRLLELSLSRPTTS